MNRFIHMIDFDHSFPIRQSIALSLVTLMLPWYLPAQDKSSAPPHVTGLKIYVLQGSGSVNYIPDGRGTTPVVEIRDDNELPVASATVEFQLPPTGPGGDFSNGTHTFSAITNIAGQAQAPFTLRPQTGSFKIQINAKIDTRSASTVITQSNSMKANEAATSTSKKRPLYKNWKFLVVAGAAATAVAVLLATRGGSSSSASTTTIGLTPGIPTYGAPH